MSAAAAASQSRRKRLLTPQLLRPLPAVRPRVLLAGAERRRCTQDWVMHDLLAKTLDGMAVALGLSLALCLASFQQKRRPLLAD